MKLIDYIKLSFGGSQVAFAESQAVTKQQVHKWIKDGFIVVDDVIYSPRREIKRAKFVICYSGGMSSALCAIEAVRKHGKHNVILLNHDISAEVESEEVKRFKCEVADYLGLEITYANRTDWTTATPIDVCKGIGGWKFGSGKILCTYELKTKPFYSWLEKNDPDKLNTYIYGFDDTPAERARAARRTAILGNQGYKTDYPLITWERTIYDTSEIGIRRPLEYAKFKHANCVGCLKAGWQHWFIVYCERPDIWQKAKEAEDEIGYAIHKDREGAVYLEDKEELFAEMKAAGVEPTEHISAARFWSDAKKAAAQHRFNASQIEFDFLAEHDAGVCLDCTV